MGMKPRSFPNSSETPFNIYGVQILIRKGGHEEWVWGAPLYGLDTSTNIVGGHFLGSLELAKSEAERHRETHKQVRIVQYVLTKWSEHYGEIL